MMDPADTSQGWKNTDLPFTQASGPAFRPSEAVEVIGNVESSDEIFRLQMEESGQAASVAEVLSLAASFRGIGNARGGDD